MDPDHEEQQMEQLRSMQMKLQQLEDKLASNEQQVKIEDTLETVRVRAMGMRSSSELAETSAVMFHQLKELGIKTIRTGVAIYDDDNEAVEVWNTIVSENQEVDRILDYFSIHVHPVFENIIPARVQKKPFAVASLVGDEVRQFYQIMSAYHVLSQQKEYNPREYFYSFFFAEGSINIVTKQELGEEDLNTMIRMANVFGLIYTRFLDLQKAEDYSKETLRQASLDRFRAEVASMRTAGDLEKITTLIWKELRIMSVPFFRCGLFIVNEKSKICQVYLAAPTGESLAAMNLPMGSFELIDRNVQHWREKKIYTLEWEKEDFILWTQSLVEGGYLEDLENYQGSQAPPEYLALHFVPFDQGMLYVGSKAVLYQEYLEIIRSLANAFSVAYARYQDFNHLEETLQELKSAQSQLIHAEKMASLGELTAGIAHEIKNPLNFINNFSELNIELIEELEEMISKGELTESIELAKNLKDNEKKVIEHGKRADGIVQSMLLHSRGSTGEKELTDINALCDEYLRLAYHGMRAKDKSFNVKLITEFGEDVPDIEVIPQDIGRVLLNLINNAFQAVVEKSKKVKNFTPKVKVQTSIEPSGGKLSEDKSQIRITISDNGPGIPDSIKGKIFQPFFTTKPAGQGTGLGLSLSYEIVKAHGGTMRVHALNEGTTSDVEKTDSGTVSAITLPVGNRR